MTYLLLDGDSIGDSFELLYLDDRLEEAIALSNSITNAIQQIGASLSACGATIHIAAGDDIVATFSENLLDLVSLSKLAGEFQTATGHTLSGGAGDTLSQATANLRRAKISGKDKIVTLEHPQ